MRLIEYGALHDAFSDTFGGMELITLDNALDVIADAPTVEAAPVVHGRWNHVEGMKTREECSQCGCRGPKFVKSYDYCPNCAAKMDL